ncbi:MAG: sulfatase-like hydrolase/transferase [Candidatus Eisenbacteria sp.]|nr:sulfatase-like hydrolase/transferase [Candidatus Eisenbacteria bacterium]
MHKKRWIVLPCLLLSNAIILVFCAFELAGDPLFFLSDPASMLVVAVALALGMTLLLGIVLVGLMLLRPRMRTHAVSIAGRLLATLAGSAFLFFLLSGLGQKLDLVAALKGWLSPRLPGFTPANHPEILWGLLWILLFVSIWRIITRATDREGIERSCVKLSLVLAPCACALFAVLVALNWLGPRMTADASQTPPKHAVLVVLDGWPAQHMKPFNHRASAKPGDAVFDQGRLFTNMRSNSVWTSAFFEVLYRGRSGHAGEENLLRLLQRQGVKTRGFFFHRNGMPETKGISAYRGFRSIYFAALQLGLLDGLGLEYNTIFLGMNGTRLRSDTRHFVFGSLLPFGRQQYSNHLTELLLPELARMRQLAPQKSFVIFHTSWGAGHTDLPKAWEEVSNDGAGQGILARAHGNEYRYEPEDEWYIEQLRTMADMTAAATERKIADFIARAAQAGLLENTIFLFTADHGSMESQGRLWYGYHPNEEVQRVPLFIVGDGITGVDERNFETIDLTQTLLQYFGAQHRAHPRARSVFDPGEKPYTTGITLSSDSWNERFVLLYKNDRKYCFNIHPQGDGSSVEQILDRFETKTIRRGEAVIQAVLPELTQAIAEYGLAHATGEQLHESYRPAHLRELAETRP